MNPRKENARRGFRDREAIRRKNASEWQPEKFFPKEEKMNASIENRSTPLWKWIIIIISIMIIGCFALAALAIWNPLGISFSPAAVVSTEAPALVEEPVSLLPTPVLVEPTEAVIVAEPTEIPVVPTEIPVIEPTQVPVPVAVTCTTPSIQASLDGQTWTEQGEYLDTVLGKRMTFTSRRLIVPNKAWNDPLTPEELKTVENTWQYMQVCIPDGLTGVIFAGGVEQGVNRYETGALLSLKPGMYQFRMRNGEVVIWYPDQQNLADDDLVRIIEQIKVGNFDIKGELSLFGVTTDLLPKMPQDLVKSKNIQIVPYLKPVVK